MTPKLTIPSLLRTVLVASALLTATACSDSPPSTTAGGSGSEDTSTSSGPSVPPVSSSGLDSTSSEASSSSSGSSSIDTGSSSEASSGSTGSGSTGSGSSSDSSSSDASDSGSTGAGASSDSGTTGGGSSSDTDGSESGTAGGDVGYCTYSCAVAADCAFLGGNPGDWACNAGSCEFIGVVPPCDPTSCSGDLACADVDGVNQCVIPCSAAGNECDVFGFVCTGVTDMGDTICESGCFGAAEGDPCIIAGLGQYGTCTAGECTCTDDTECTAAGMACND